MAPHAGAHGSPLRLAPYCADSRLVPACAGALPRTSSVTPMRSTSPTDSLIIYSREDISSRLAELTSEYEAAITTYEARVPEITTVEGMLQELDQLAHPQ
jgi:hypothetical protein